MIYMIGLGSGRKAVKLSTISAITSALDIPKLLDCRPENPSNPLLASTFPSDGNHGYTWIGDIRAGFEQLKSSMDTMIVAKPKRAYNFGD